MLENPTPERSCPATLQINPAPNPKTTLSKKNVPVESEKDVGLLPQ